MKTITRLVTLALAGVLVFAALASAQEDADAIMKKSHITYYYAGNDGIADVNMVLTDKNGKERERVFTMLRMDVEDGGNQMYYTYFREPSDVARMTFMVHKKADGNDLRWIYVPAVDLIRPISADDKNSSFVGSDFSYEDVSGRHWNEDTHTLAREAEHDGQAVWVIESVPKDEGYDGFAKKVSYISKDNYLPLMEEYFDEDGEMIRKFTAETIKEMDGILTVTLRKMEDLKKGSFTTVEFSDIQYDEGLEEDLFTERYMKNPPRKYIR